MRVIPAALAAAGVVIAGLGGLACYAYRRDIDRARARVLAGSRAVETPCGAIEYAVIGDGPPVLVVHGAGGGYDQGLDFAKSLAARGFRVIAMSRFGYLGTALPADASPAAQADAHACLLDALDIPRAAVVGASAGAPSSMLFALSHPDRCSALVLLVPLAYAPRPVGERQIHASVIGEFVLNTILKSEFLYWLATRIARRTLVRTILATPPEVLYEAGADERARVRQILENVLPLSRRQPGLLNDMAVASSLPRYDLERITVPTLAISVADDLFGTFESARYTAEHIPGARFIGYASGGHIWAGHQDEVLSEITAFVRALPPAYIQ
jgi:2-hydroxy-6-oxonona-2,4-dienedioate hydrolase